MEKTETELTHQQSLDVIQEMIIASKKGINENGFSFILWGWLIIIASIISYVLLAIIHFKYHYYIWPVMMVMGFAINYIYEYRRAKTSRVKTYVDEFMDYLWGGFCAGLVIIITYSMFSGISPGPYIFIMTGVATLASGGALRFKPLVYGGIVFYVAAILMMIVGGRSYYQFLIMAMAMILGYLIPGYMLLRKYKEENV